MSWKRDSELAMIFPGHSFMPVCHALEDKARLKLDQLTKPCGSLGRLEDIAARLYAIGNGIEPLRVEPCILFTVAGDHGIAKQNVSPFPQAVTRQMVDNILAGGAASSVLCKVNSIAHVVVDAGCSGGAFAEREGLVDRRLGSGTADMSSGPAMTPEECKRGLREGLALAFSAIDNGYGCIAAGEMGIANSSAATALYCALLGLDPAEITGPGCGASPQMRQHKADMIAKSLAANAEAIKSGSPLAILAALGGFEITVIAGIMLGCACRSIPFLVDGFICAAAYAAAQAFFPPLYGYAFLSHVSAEPAFARIARLLSPYPPLLDLGMRLGEGTGAAIAFPLLKAAAAIYNDMASMASAGVSATEADRICLP